MRVRMTPPQGKRIGGKRRSQESVEKNPTKNGRLRSKKTVFPSARKKQQNWQRPSSPMPLKHQRSSQRIGRRRSTRFLTNQRLRWSSRHLSRQLQQLRP